MSSPLILFFANGFWAWIQTHQVLATLTAYWLFSAAVSPMPQPKPGGSGFYAWAYGFLHAILQLASGAIMRIPALRNFLGNGGSSSQGPTPPAGGQP